MMIQNASQDFIGRDAFVFFRSILAFAHSKGDLLLKQDNRKIASDLIESTIKVIARDGFDKASTRNIAKECGIADAYIYLHFEDKDDLFAKTFQKEDTALAEEVKKHLSILDQQGITNEDKIYFLFNKVWMHLIAYPDSCRFYVQYYYSPYYQKYSAQEHASLWMPIAERVKVLFRPETDVKAALRLVLNTMIGQAIKATANTSADQDSIAQSNYELILGMVQNCLLDE